MPIDYGRLRSLTARELIAALIRDGFTLDWTDSPVPINTTGTRIAVG